LLIIHLYAGESASEFVFYDDDGISFDYQTGTYSRRTLRYLPDANSFVMGKSEGQYLSSFKQIRVVLHGFSSMSEVEVNGQTRQVHKDVNRFFAGLEKYDPIKDPEPAPEESVQVVEFPFDNGDISIEWGRSLQ
jgi:alpha-glucosidase